MPDETMTDETTATEQDDVAESSDDATGAAADEGSP